MNNREAARACCAAALAAGGESAAVLVLDRDGLIEAASEGLLRLFGLSAAALLALPKPPLPLIHAPQHAEFLSLFAGFSTAAAGDDKLVAMSPASWQQLRLVCVDQSTHALMNLLVAVCWPSSELLLLHFVVDQRPPSTDWFGSSTRLEAEPCSCAYCDHARADKEPFGELLSTQVATLLGRYEKLTRHRISDSQFDLRRVVADMADRFPLSLRVEVQDSVPATVLGSCASLIELLLTLVDDLPSRSPLSTLIVSSPSASSKYIRVDFSLRRSADQPVSHSTFSKLRHIIAAKIARRLGGIYKWRILPRSLHSSFSSPLSFFPFASPSSTTQPSTSPLPSNSPPNLASPSSSSSSSAAPTTSSASSTSLSSATQQLEAYLSLPFLRATEHQQPLQPCKYDETALAFLVFSELPVIAQSFQAAGRLLNFSMIEAATTADFQRVLHDSTCSFNGIILDPIDEDCCGELLNTIKLSPYWYLPILLYARLPMASERLRSMDFICKLSHPLQVDELAHFAQCMLPPLKLPSVLRKKRDRSAAARGQQATTKKRRSTTSSSSDLTLSRTSALALRRPSSASALLSQPSSSQPSSQSSSAAASPSSSHTATPTSQSPSSSLVGSSSPFSSFSPSSSLSSSPSSSVTTATTTTSSSSSSSFSSFSGATRVLIVEDNTVNQAIEQNILASIAIESDCLDNGADVIERYQEAPYRYSVILMDTVLPLLDGFRATEQVRQFEAKHHIAPVPIIAVTGVASGSNPLPNATEHALAAGMNDFISKPIDVPTFCAKVKKWAALSKQARAPSDNEPTIFNRPVSLVASNLTDYAELLAGIQDASQWQMIVDVINSRRIPLSVDAVRLLKDYPVAKLVLVPEVPATSELLLQTIAGFPCWLASLRHLDISSMRLLRDRSLALLAPLTSLRTLRMHRSSSVSAGALKQLAAAIPKLDLVDSP